MEITIKSRKLGREFTFWKSAGDNYVYDSTYQPGTLGKQICEGGYYSGNTLTATDESFEGVCRRWLRSYVKRNG
jgi:hypothetical protein